MNSKKTFLVAIILLFPFLEKSADAGSLTSFFSSSKITTETSPAPKTPSSSEPSPTSATAGILESACTTEWKGTFPECRFIPIDDVCTFPQAADCRDADGSEALWVITGYSCDSPMPSYLPRAYVSHGDRNPVSNAGPTIRATCESGKAQCYDRADSCERGTAPGSLTGAGCPYLPPVKCRVPEGIHQSLSNLLGTSRIEPTLIVYDYVPGSLEGIPRVITADETVTSGMIIQSPNPELIQCITNATGRNASWRR